MCIKQNHLILKLLKQDVDKYLKSDDEIIKLEQKVTYISSVVDYLDRTIKTNLKSWLSNKERNRLAEIYIWRSLKCNP